MSLYSAVLRIVIDVDTYLLACAKGHTRIPSTEAVQRTNIHIATSIGGNSPLEDVWIDTYGRVIPGLMDNLAGAPWLGRLSVGSEPMESRGWIDIVFGDSRSCVSGGY